MALVLLPAVRLLRHKVAEGGGDVGVLALIHSHLAALAGRPPLDDVVRRRFCQGLSRHRMNSYKQP
eukprot:scaffold143_cov260-Pinguiococcus_pyrenoidosus.AAC.37